MAPIWEDRASPGVEGWQEPGIESPSSVFSGYSGCLPHDVNQTPAAPDSILHTRPLPAAPLALWGRHPFLGSSTEAKGRLKKEPAALP